jgi:hypothetical protein
MAGWGGKGSVEFEVERKLIDGKPVLLDDSDRDDVEIVTIKLRVSGSASFTPGRKYGPIDTCYDDEGDQEIQKVIRIQKSKPEEELSINFLTKEEQEIALEQLCEKVRSGDEGPDYESSEDF